MSKMQDIWFLTQKTPKNQIIFWTDGQAKTLIEKCPLLSKTIKTKFSLVGGFYVSSFICFFFRVGSM